MRQALHNTATVVQCRFKPMACADSVVTSKLPVGVKDRLESLVDNVKIVTKQIKSKITQWPLLV